MSNSTERRKVTDVRDWDSEYREGAHWDRPYPSSQLSGFLSRLSPAAKILDAGCGAGRDSIYLAGLGYWVTGVDVSSQAIYMASQRAVGLAPLSFCVGRLEAMPLTSDAFDAIYSGYTLQRTFFYDALQELSRVLKPGGVLYAVMLTVTKYATPNAKDLSIPVSEVLTALCRCPLRLIEKTIGVFEEEDQDGPHSHERLILVAVKNEI